MENTPVAKLRPDSTNPRKSDQARMALLNLSIAKLGFIMPVYATKDGLLLSGHQRLTVALGRGISCIPTETVELSNRDVKGVNILFNRATNDFTAFDTGSKGRDKLHYSDVIAAADALPDFVGEDWYALRVEHRSIARMGRSWAHLYDKKATVMADNMLRLGVRIPIVLSERGVPVNGIHRFFAAKEKGVTTWPIITIPNDVAEVANTFLNYLSMDFHVDEEFAGMLRYSAYRRPQNNRGVVPKAYRFWANDHKTLPDKDSYSIDYWRKFREIHGPNWLLDFGAGLGKVAPFLRTKGIDCVDFEPYRIDPDGDAGKPDPAYSRKEAKRFLDEVADGRRFSSIFLASVLNSIPFARDRLSVLCIVHALCDKDTMVYGTCRDISDFNYEYGGIRNANYFVFDSEPGVRVGDVMHQPKIQKFHTVEELKNMSYRFWMDTDTWPGGNVFYWRARNPKQPNLRALRESLMFEFGLPYADGSTMGLSEYALDVFGRRLGVDLKSIS